MRHSGSEVGFRLKKPDKEDQTPIPGLRGMEHIGFTVPDINEACDFLVNILGAEVLYTAAVHYEAPNQAKQLPLNSDIGGHHLAFYVDDMVPAIAFLKENGVKVLGEPTPYTEGSNLGLT